MTEIDPLIAQILLKGDDEFLEKLKHVGETAENSLGKLQAAASSGREPLNMLADRILYVAAAISGIAAATIGFIEQQTALSQATQLLAESFGSSAGQLQELEAIFASSGVKVEQFERFATRLTTTIARQWPQIAESIKMYATENDAATLRVREAILRVQDAQKALGDHSSERSSQMEHDNEAISASYLKLQFAAQHAAQEQLSAMLSVRGAQLGVTAALQHLAELQGAPPSAAEKQSLAISQAQLSVDNARKAEAEARVAQQEKAAGAALKQQQMEQEYDDLRRKAAKNARDDAEQRTKDENAVKNAVIARAEAEDKADKLALTSISSIRDALKGVETGNKDMATTIDLSRVSVDNLVKGMIALAAETSKGVKPTGWEALSTISKTLAEDQKRVKAGLDPLIDGEQQLAIVTRLAGTSMQALGKSASEILDVLKNSSTSIEDLKNHADAFSKIDPTNVKAFRGALNELNFQISLLSQQFAAAAAPAFTEFLNSIKESLTSSTGLLHIFGEGIRGIASGIGAVIQGWQKVGEVIESAIGNGIEKGTARQAMLLLLAGFVAAFSTSWVAIPVAIGLVVVAVGYVVEHLKDIQTWAENNRAKFVAIGVVIGGLAALIFPWITAITLVIAAVVLIYENWDKVTAAIGRAWEHVKDNELYQFLEVVITRLKEAYDWWSKLGTN